MTSETQTKDLKKKKKFKGLFVIVHPHVKQTDTNQCLADTLNQCLTNI